VTVPDAAARIVEAFGAHDTAAYFRGFAADATSVFRTTAQPAGSLSDHEQLWYGWERDGFRVLERETIVFHKRDGQWPAVHEHLSGDPQ
jgi:hypothetical protein